MKNRFLILSLSLVVLLPSGVWCQEDVASQLMEARLTVVTGSVYIHPHDAFDNDFLPAQRDMPLEEGDLVKTTDGSAEISLDGKSVIHLDSDTEFRTDSLSPKASRFYLGLGRLTAKIRSLFEEEHMEFKTPILVASVRGTELAIAQDGDREGQVGVFEEGQVAVRSVDDPKEVLLGPDQESDVRWGQAPMAPRKMEAMLRHQERMSEVRKRAEFMRTHWTARSLEHRREKRQEFRKQRLIHRNDLHQFPGSKPNLKPHPKRLRK